MKFNKKSIMAISLVVGAVMLSTSAFANYINSSGYTACKEAGKKLLKEKNYTLALDGKVNIDDEEAYSINIKQLLNADGDVKLNLISKSTDCGDVSENEEYFQDGQRITGHKYTDTETDSSVPTNKDMEYYIYDDEMYSDSVGDLFNVTENSNDLIDKEIRFAELAMDAVVGDLKNNVILVNTDNDINTYAIDLESYQIPEIVNVGLSLATGFAVSDYEYTEEELQQEYEYSPGLKVAKDMKVENGNLKVGLDNEGRLVSADCTINFSGKDLSDNPHNASIIFSISVSDYGTTQPQRFDVSGKKVSYSSQWRQDRLADIEEELQDEDLTEEDKKYLEDEKKDLQEQIENNSQDSEYAPTAEEPEKTAAAEEEPASIGVIGGADGPTSIMVN